MFSRRLPRWVHGIIRSMSIGEEWERSSLCICHTVSFWDLVVIMLLRVMFVHMERRWRHVSFLCSGHGGQGNWVGQLVFILWLPMY
jgi:hypothetical protein